MDLLHKTLIVCIMLLPMVGAQAQRSEPLSFAPNLVSAEYYRSSYEDWTVQLDHNTPFVPVDPDLPEPFFFDDLEIDHAVLVEGHISPFENLIEAEIVFVFTDVSQYPRFVGGPPHGGERIFGLVSAIDLQMRSFHVWTNEFQGELMDVAVVPNAEFWDAPIGSPMVPIHLWNLHPGDPVMVHGTMINDHFFGNAFIRSMDWCTERSGSDDGTVMEVYGWINNIFQHPNGEPVVSVNVDSMTGDPNHQSFSKIVGPAGGYVYFPWGYLNFPPGALEDLVNIQVTGDFMFWWTLENIYQFYPSMQFNVPVEIEIRYFNLEGIDPEQIRLSWFDEITGTWRLACHMTHCWEQHCFRGQIDHFSRYSLSTNNRPLQGIVLQPSN
ncbi:hypothetical protein JW823_00565 [bacterium]|nr:hypothetical protein [candidate division CSSED10-310 bacterium]